jgi:hypothetical protein
MIWKEQTKDNDPAHPLPPMVAPPPLDDIKSKDEWNVTEAHLIWMVRQTEASTRSGIKQTAYIFLVETVGVACFTSPCSICSYCAKDFHIPMIGRITRSHFYDNTIRKEHVFEVLNQN